MTKSINDIKVSVIVPICNVEKYLEQALSSLCDQTHKNIEIIALNDGSKDNSIAIINEFAKKDSRIIVVDKENEGYGKTCNRGLDIASGEYIAILEPDDWINKNMFSDMLQFVWRDDLLKEENGKIVPDVDIIKTPWIEVKNWNNPEMQYEIPGPMFRYIKQTNKPITLHDCPDLIEFHPSIWTCLYKKSFLDVFKIRFPEYPGAGWADNPFLIDTLYQARSIMYLDKPFYHYRADILGSTRNHNSPEKVALPFNRWLDMTKKLEELECNDDEIWKSHYVRGFNYMYGAILDDGWSNSVVQEKTKEMFSIMKDDIVIDNPKISTDNKIFYKEVTGCSRRIPDTKITYLKRLLRAEATLFKQFGFIEGIRITGSKFVRKRQREIQSKKITERMQALHDNELKLDKEFVDKQNKGAFKTPRTIRGL